MKLKNAIIMLKYYMTMSYIYLYLPITDLIGRYDV